MLREERKRVDEPKGCVISNWFALNEAKTCNIQAEVSRQHLNSLDDYLVNVAESFSVLAHIG